MRVARPGRRPRALRPEAHAAYSPAKLDEMISVLARLFPEISLKQARQIATGALATMMGSIVLARAISDQNLSDDILAAGRQTLRRGRARQVIATTRRSRHDRHLA